jgi:hypothetical protein
VNEEAWHIEEGEGPLIATAIHDGHGLRREVAELMLLSDADRLREEDPFTGTWTDVAPTRVVVRQSRFEVDLNRAREKAVYLKPADAWGLRVWKSPPPPKIIARSLSRYDDFYAAMGDVVGRLVSRCGRVVVLDLHSYNHRREGPEAPHDDPARNPEVNLGTGTMDRERWAKLVDGFLADVRGFDFRGRRLDVRENVKFRGGHFSRWLHATFPDSVCCLAVEFKKFFMDEWTGRPDEDELRAVHEVLRTAAKGLRRELEVGE